MSALEETFLLQLKALKLPAPDRESRFHPIRRWRFDFCWPDKLLAVEIEGGTYSGGRHTRGVGFEEDCEKYNAAQELGWRVFRFTGKHVKAGAAIEQVQRILSQKIAEDWL